MERGDIFWIADGLENFKAEGRVGSASPTAPKLSSDTERKEFWCDQAERYPSGQGDQGTNFWLDDGPLSVKSFHEQHRSGVPTMAAHRPLKRVFSSF